MNVLAVDDSQFILAVVKKYLEEIPDITQVLLCHDPIRVKSLVEENEIDIMILDIIMPEISGIDILAQLKSDSRYDDMPIIMLTSLDDSESYKRCFELGAFDYINKPINVLEFNARLKVAIESKNNSNRLKYLLGVTEEQNEELKVKNAMLEEAQMNLVQSEKMAAIGQMAAGIAHEINNPLGFVNSNFEILMKYFRRVSDFLNTFTIMLKEEKCVSDFHNCPSISEIRQKYEELKLEFILNELEGIFSDSVSGIQRITEIVQSLRVFSRSSKDDEKDNCSLEDIIHQVLLITRNEVKYSASIEINVPSDIFLYCNRIQIGQVLVNLILNSVQAIMSQKRSELGLIQIIAQKNEQEVVIQVIDDGPGISDENMKKIFDPFFTTKEIEKGTGLGLSISYDIIVNKHKGKIDVESEYGKGAVFTITLPIVTAV